MFLAAALATVTLIAAVLPPIVVGGEKREADPVFPAQPGYLLPWEGGEIQDVTQGEETSFTHNGGAAYAFDIGMNYDTVVAARSGKVTFVRDDSNSGGCNAIFSSAANFVVIDHGDGTSALYLHLAYASAKVKVGDEVKQGTPLATSGATGVTCGADNKGPGAHLHFQVQRTGERYFQQSLPIAFDDIAKNEGVPYEGQSLVSGNYGPGQPQKIKLTPHRTERVFNPVAVAANPLLVQAILDETPTVLPAPSETLVPPAADTATPEPSATETPWPEDTPRPESTGEPEPTDTPVPTATEPPPTDTAPPADTPVAEGGGEALSDTTITAGSAAPPTPPLDAAATVPPPG